MAQASKQASDASDKKSHKFLALLLLLGALVLSLVYFSDQGAETSAKKMNDITRSESYRQSVSKHMMYTNDKVEYQKKRMEVDNELALHNMQKSKGLDSHRGSRESQVDLSYEDQAAEMAKELGKGPRKEEISSVEDAIQKELFTAQQAAEYSQAYKEEYARQFVENARRGGYKVILSEDLSRVLSVTPIRNPSKESFEVFGSGSRSAQ